MDIDDLKDKFFYLVDHPAVQTIYQLLRDWKPDNWVILYIISAFVIGFLIARRRQSVARFYKRLLSRYSTYQNHGEFILSNTLMNDFKAPDYHLMNHITLELPDGTTQIDHILISRFGVFVIETKDYTGWIFSGLKQKTWTQVVFMRRYKFQNPIHQNLRHVKAVQSCLDFLPAENIKSVVVFAGDAKFKYEIPVGVFFLENICDYIREQSTEIMSLNRLQFCVGRIETMRLAVSKKTDIEHIENLESRHNNFENMPDDRGNIR